MPFIPGKYKIEARYNKNDGIRISLTKNQIVTLEAEAGKVYELVAYKGDNPVYCGYFGESN